MKNILLTGASGGMGLETIHQLILDGYEVYGLDINNIDEFDHFHFYKTDITNEESIINTFKSIDKNNIKFDAIIHLSGIYELDSLIEIDEQSFVRVFDVNVFGVYRINKIFLPLLNEKGKIVIITSELASLDPLPFTGIYAISKSTLDKYAYSLRMELQLLGYQVVVIRPGAVSTPLLDVSMNRLERFKDKTTHYQYNSKNFYNVVNRVEARKISPKKIALLVSKVIKKKRPRYIYNINRNPLLLLLNLLPKRTQNRIIKHVLTKNQQSGK